MAQDKAETEMAEDTYKLGHSIFEHGVDGIIGGFPCQDISIAGRGEGIQRCSAGKATTRSGLFWEMEKTFRLVRPKYWLMENVAAILDRGMGDVLGAVASCGCDAEWDCVAAGTIGAPHHRARTYILAYDNSVGGERKLPQQIQRERVFSWLENVRSVEDLPERSDLYASKLCGGGDGVAKRLHAIGNGNPPQIIKLLTEALS